MYLDFRRYQHIQRHGDTTEAEVIALVPVQDSEYPQRLAGYYPVLRFRTRFGAEVELPYDRVSHDWQMNQRLPVRYLPLQPEQFLLMSRAAHVEDMLLTGLLVSGTCVVLSICLYLL
ncbi:hypothetical protein B0919_20160 [Hymenobacter sp. CRA2]|nr:DUF3592 domain-containing protein [Hymenobacter sp. CRA2]OON66905.1 hypothetical protein B0919_20160 [Hymenobacter sp. CRA2]